MQPHLLKLLLERLYVPLLPLLLQHMRLAEEQPTAEAELGQQLVLRTKELVSEILAECAAGKLTFPA